jgi:hypothetical protein
MNAATISSTRAVGRRRVAAATLASVMVANISPAQLQGEHIDNSGKVSRRETGCPGLQIEQPVRSRERMCVLHRHVACTSGASRRPAPADVESGKTASAACYRQASKFLIAT